MQLEKHIRLPNDHDTAQKLRIWSHVSKKSLMENFISCAVWFKKYFHKH